MALNDYLLAQYADKPNINALIELIEEEFARHTKLKKDIAERMWPDVAEGKQLDMCGEVADIDRLINGNILNDFFGFPHHGDNTFGRAKFYRYGQPYTSSSLLSDSDYRMAILAKVCKNTTDGSRQATIDSLKRIFRTEHITVVNVGNAKIRIGIGRRVSDNELSLIEKLELLIKSAGVGVVYLYFFDTNVFGFTKRGRNLGGFLPMGKGAFSRILQIEGSRVL